MVQKLLALSSYASNIIALVPFLQNLLVLKGIFLLMETDLLNTY